MPNSIATSSSKATPVRLHHVPNFFRLRLLKAFGSADGYTSGHAVLNHSVVTATKITNAPGYHWLDHWGSTVINGATYFVSEPYAEWPLADTDWLRPADFIANEANCRLLILPVSAWNMSTMPGTIRLLFIPNEPDSAEVGR